jgi:hypothetical protein
MLLADSLLVQARAHAIKQPQKAGRRSPDSAAMIMTLIPENEFSALVAA